VAHFHTVLSLGAVFGLFVVHYGLAGLTFGAAVCDGAAIQQAFLLTAGACFIFGPMHALGVIGMSRRVPEFADVYAPFIQLGSIGTILLLPSVLLVLRLLSGCALGSRADACITFDAPVLVLVLALVDVCILVGEGPLLIDAYAQLAQDHALHLGGQHHA
jgi:hypothetical protein